MNIEFQQKRAHNERIFLNVSGELYETNSSTLERFPDTLLGNRDKRLRFFNASSQSYFINHSKMFFDSILFFYQSNGLLRCPPGLPISLFEEECRFFELPDSSIKRVQTNALLLLHKTQKQHRVDATTFKGIAWNVLNHPDTSRSAACFAAFSHFLLVLSVGTICFETLPYLQEGTKISLQSPFSIWEFSLNVWFLIHLGCRIVCTPCRRTLFRSFLTWIDVFSILPYFIMLWLKTNSGFSDHVFRFQHVCQVFRILRLLRLSNYSRRLRVIGLAIRSSADVYVTLFLCVAIIVILGGSFVYFFELDMHEKSHFHNIPSGMYWSVISMTTVGYGDYYPQSTGGKLFGGCFMVFGAMMLSIPMLTIIANHVAIRKQNTKDKAYL